MTARAWSSSAVRDVGGKSRHERLLPRSCCDSTASIGCRCHFAPRGGRWPGFRPERQPLRMRAITSSLRETARRAANQHRRAVLIQPRCPPGEELHQLAGVVLVGWGARGNTAHVERLLPVVEHVQVAAHGGVHRDGAHQVAVVPERAVHHDPVVGDDGPRVGDLDRDTTRSCERPRNPRPKLFRPGHVRLIISCPPSTLFVQRVGEPTAPSNCSSRNAAAPIDRHAVHFARSRPHLACRTADRRQNRGIGGWAGTFRTACLVGGGRSRCRRTAVPCRIGGAVRTRVDEPRRVRRRAKLPCALRVGGRAAVHA